MIVYLFSFNFNKCVQIYAIFKNIIIYYLNFKITKQFSVFWYNNRKKVLRFCPKSYLKCTVLGFNDIPTRVVPRFRNVPISTLIFLSTNTLLVLFMIEMGRFCQSFFTKTIIIYYTRLGGQSYSYTIVIILMFVLCISRRIFRCARHLLANLYSNYMWTYLHYIRLRKQNYYYL